MKRKDDSAAATLAIPTPRDLSEKALFAPLATVGSAGAPRSKPRWFVYDSETSRVRLTHTKSRHNHRYLKDEPRVALSITDPDDEYRYLQLRGEVEKEEDD